MTKADWTNISALASGNAYIKSSGTSLTDLAKVTKVFVSSNSVIGATDVCSTTPDATTTQICNPSRKARRAIFALKECKPRQHIRLSHSIHGYAAAPSGGQAATTNGQASFIFYHGNGSAPPPQTSVGYSNQTGTLGTAFSGFTTAASEVCMDITDATPPRITLWATGVNTADCKSRSTLTATNALINKSDWTSRGRRKRNRWLPLPRCRYHRDQGHRLFACYGYRFLKSSSAGNLNAYSGRRTDFTFCDQSRFSHRISEKRAVHNKNRRSTEQRCGKNQQRSC
jgi:hypothetical protein